jgi:site-specific DNA recombinase
MSMEPTYTRKGIKHYQYVCHNHTQGKHCPSLNRTIAAGEIEREVEKQVRYVLQNTENILDKKVPRNLEKLNGMWKDLFPVKQQEIIKQLIKTVWIREEGI